MTTFSVAIFVILLLLLVSTPTGSANWIFKASQSDDHQQTRYYHKRQKPLPIELHSVKFAVKLKNLDLLEQRLHNVSDPSHEDYGKHWSKEEVGRLIKNEEATEKLLSYLEEEGGYVIKERSILDEFIVVEGRIESWEKMFATTFFEYEHLPPPSTATKNMPGTSSSSSHSRKKRLIRAEAYSLPQSLHPHIGWVFGVIDFPINSLKHGIIEATPPKAPSTPTYLRGNATAYGKVTAKGYVTPELLNDQYSIFTNTGNSLTSQAAIACIGQTLRPSDLKAFQTYFKLPIQGLAGIVGGHVNDSACLTDPTNCAEANLDFQYLMAISQKVPTFYLYDYNCDYVSLFSSLKTPPNVISISYGGDESNYGLAYSSAFNTMAVQLGVMGTTIVVGSGDDGVASSRARGDPSLCSYDPQFPAASPYVLSVGATQGPESDKEEVACQGDNNGVITSGGGFSLFNSLPSYQSTVVTNYFKAVAGTSLNPVSGYKTSARGYPDISAVGHAYPVFINNYIYYLSGTSATAPVLAGMIAVVNSARKKLGKSNLGFVNPFIYNNARYFIQDVVSGNNKCTVYGMTCCSEGFYATSGWDAVTGLGTLNFANFYNMAVTGSVAPSASPTKPPTAKPTTRPTRCPSATPSRKPTASPSRSPTTTPSALPTTTKPTSTPSITPTRLPSQPPSLTPSIQPTIQPTVSPSFIITASPSTEPTPTPSITPTAIITEAPSNQPTSYVSPDPSTSPTNDPTEVPSSLPSINPTTTSPSEAPTTPSPSSNPSDIPSATPSTIFPTIIPSLNPTNAPSITPTVTPTSIPTTPIPSNPPTKIPTIPPSVLPTRVPSIMPTIVRTRTPTIIPTVIPTNSPPTRNPTTTPSTSPTTKSPSTIPTFFPSTRRPSVVPSLRPSSLRPSRPPSTSPTFTAKPSISPSIPPTQVPTRSPSNLPTMLPTMNPSARPSTGTPSMSPTRSPTRPTTRPTNAPTTKAPSRTPTVRPTKQPISRKPSTLKPTSSKPTVKPTFLPTTLLPSRSPSNQPSINRLTIIAPTRSPTTTSTATRAPSYRPTRAPTVMPTTKSPTPKPTTPQVKRLRRQS